MTAFDGDGGDSDREAWKEGLGEEDVAIAPITRAWRCSAGEKDQCDGCLIHKSAAVGYSVGFDTKYLCASCAADIRDQMSIALRAGGHGG